MNTLTQPKSVIDSLSPLIGGSRLTCAVLEIAVDLGIFTKLKGQELSLAEASAAWSLPAPSVRALAQYLCSMGLLHYQNGKLSNSALAGTLVDDSSNMSRLRVLLNLNTSTEELRKKLEAPPHLNTSTEEFRKKLEAPPPQVWYQIRDEGKEPYETTLGEIQFYEAMHKHRIRWGEELAARYDFGNHRVLLDVGGASGGWCMGVRKHFPHLQCILFDIPPACQIAQQIIADAGETQNIRITTGSFFTDALPTGADVALLANVLHDWTVEDGRKILRRVYSALPSGGVLLVPEFYLEDDWSGDVKQAANAFSVLGAEGKGGWQPAYGEMESLLQDEGFVEAERRPNLVIGKKPTR